MAVTVSVLFVLAIAVGALARFGGMRVFPALVCIALGFELASSPLAPAISRFIASIIHAA